MLLLWLAAAVVLPSAAAPAAAAEPGAGEAAALIGLAAAMGAPHGLLASWDTSIEAKGSLCG